MMVAMPAQCAAASSPPLNCVHAHATCQRSPGRGPPACVHPLLCCPFRRELMLPVSSSRAALDWDVGRMPRPRQHGQSCDSSRAWVRDCRHASPTPKEGLTKAQGQTRPPPLPSRRKKTGSKRTHPRDLPGGGGTGACTPCAHAPCISPSVRGQGAAHWTCLLPGSGLPGPLCLALCSE